MIITGHIKNVPVMKMGLYVLLYSWDRARKVMHSPVKVRSTDKLTENETYIPDLKMYVRDAKRVDCQF